jgi:hypothetical protein
MFLYRVLEQLWACPDGYFCLKAESILHLDRQYMSHRKVYKWMERFKGWQKSVDACYE